MQNNVSGARIVPLCATEYSVLGALGARIIDTGAPPTDTHGATGLRLDSPAA